MKKRLLKKQITRMTDATLYEAVGYCKGKRMRTLVENEFDKRFKDALAFDEELAESLMAVSQEADDLLMK